MGYRIGIDAGSKTIKVVVVDEHGTLVHSLYRRHRSDIKTTLAEALHDLAWRHGDLEGTVGVTGSAGIGVAELLGLPFVQEVIATTHAVQCAYPEADAIIELGGEDAKVVYLTGGLEQRMNATCAGGTGGFIDTMAFMLGTSSKNIELAGPRSQPHLPHRLALRRVRPNRRAAAAQRRGAHVRFGRQRAGSRRAADAGRIGLRTSHQGNGRVPGRAAGTHSRPGATVPHRLGHLPQGRHQAPRCAPVHGDGSRLGGSRGGREEAKGARRGRRAGSRGAARGAGRGRRAGSRDARGRRGTRDARCGRSGGCRDGKGRSAGSRDAARSARFLPGVRAFPLRAGRARAAGDESRKRPREAASPVRQRGRAAGVPHAPRRRPHGTRAPVRLYRPTLPGA